MEVLSHVREVSFFEFELRRTKPHICFNFVTCDINGNLERTLVSMRHGALSLLLSRMGLAVSSDRHVLFEDGRFHDMALLP